jgi:gliding motility-associated-like protein
VVLCCNFCARAQGGFSNQGTEFWTAYMDHINGVGGNDGSQMYLYITADVNTPVKVEVADGSFSGNYTVAARSILSVPIPASAFLGSQGQFTKGIHITSDKPVAVYAHIFALSVSGATLLLPVNTLAKDYISINYTQLSNSVGTGANGQPTGSPSYSTFAVIGTEDHTTVEITPSQTLLNGQAANTPFSVTLNKGDVYQGLSATDLTGTRIRTISNADGVCKKVAVFSGSSKIGIGCRTSNFTSDNLFQQVYPTASWGKSYITAPLSGRDYDVFRIVLSNPNTVVSLNGANIPAGQFTGGLYYEFNSKEPNVIIADKPIQVVQYAVTQLKSINCIDKPNNTDIGDPEMIYLNPLEQTIDHVTLNSTSNYQIRSNYINVVIKKTAVPTFTLDGVPYTTFTTVSGNPAYAYAQINVSAGVHHISAADGFNAIAYGFGNAESYGYAAGTNLKNLNEFITLQDPVTKAAQPNGCTNASYNLQITLPFITTDIKWDFKDGSAPVQFIPVPKTIIKDGKTLYVYEYLINRTFTPGDHSIVATVLNPVADNCGSYDDVEFDFNIAEPPKANFTQTGNCLGDATLFKDVSETQGSDIKTWLWDFGDGQTAIVQNPSHTYMLTGDHPVKLTVTNQNGCSNESPVKMVHIGAKPVADFKFPPTNCPATDILFTDQSTSADGPIVKWLWDFGDGLPIVERTNNTPFSHQFTTANTYPVKLTVVNANGCASEVKSKPVLVHDQPVVDFTFPDVCTSDITQFTNKSTIADNTGADFTYQWNFGDMYATPANANTSAVKDAQHRFTKAGTYHITLMVTSKYGCVYSKGQTLSVNSDDVKTDVTLLNDGNLCSNQPVILVNNSKVGIGKITKLVVIYDVDNPLTTTKTFDNPALGPLPPYAYEQFNDGTRNYRIKVTAYAGGCNDPKMLDLLTLKGVPTITIPATPALCPESTPVQLVPVFQGAKNGTETYSGTGISASGLFDPAKAGTGTFDITYTYNSNVGCFVTVPHQVMVYPSPTASAGNDFTMLEGSAVTIKATAGNAIAYKWYPSTGLDHDDVLNPVASPTESTTYKLVVTSATDCTAIDEVNINVLKKLVIPNFFTPNGDGYNDFWEIKYLNDYPNNTVDIFNRYGTKLYSSTGYGVPWDGKYRGADVPPGTYYYIINPKNGRKIISGSLTLIR